MFGATFFSRHIDAIPKIRLAIGGTTNTGITAHSQRK
jgi:hypothetical protein